MLHCAVHLIARGYVQGVGFRFFVRDQAASRGIKGWVKNLSDGTVEIVAEGEKEILEGFINKIKKGPMFGRVSELMTEWIEPTKAFKNFSITF